MESQRNEAKKGPKESLLIVRPAIRSLGLDYLHVTLIALIIVLIAFAFGLSQFKQGILIQSCSYGAYANQTCITPVHNSSQALAAAQQILASYTSVNTSLSLLPYYTYANRANVSYIANQSEWLVTFPYSNPLVNNETQYFSILLYDSNLSVAMPLIQTIPPTLYTKNMVISKGVVKIYNKVACTQGGPMQVYAFVDPYAPQALQGISSALNATSRYGNSINLTYKFIFTGYAISQYKGYGINETQAMAEYLWCASTQPRFQAFIANFSLVYNGRPMQNYTLEQVAQGSGLNTGTLNACVENSTSVLDAQATIAQFYGIITTPSYVVDCQYDAIPVTLNESIAYALNSR